MRKATFRKTISILTIGGFIFASQAAISFASVTSKATATPKPKTAAAPNRNTNQNQNNGRGFGQGFGQGRNRQQFDIKPVLDKLVKAKTITAAQETKILAYEKKRTADRQAQMQKFQSMTPQERQDYFNKIQGQNQGQNQGQGFGRGQGQGMNQYADLVKNKTVTQKQADAITKAIQAARPQRNRGNGQNGGFGGFGGNNNGNNGNNNNN